MSFSGTTCLDDITRRTALFSCNIVGSRPLFRRYAMIGACAKGINPRNKSGKKCSRLSVEMDESFLCSSRGSFRRKQNMKKDRLLGGLIVATLVGAFLVSASPAFAVKQFYDEFKEVYVNKGSLDGAAVAKAKCNICHEGKSKKNKNAYGKLLDKLLDRKKDAKNPEKIRQALATVESEKSPSGETYGELIKEGKLP